jgi:hypothetical protein
MSACQNVVHRQEKNILLLFALLVVSMPVFGFSCGNCGAEDQPELALTCGICGGDLHSTRSRLAARSTATLVIEILYTGNAPDRLPEQGKLLINRKAYGEITLVERESRDPIMLNPSRHGLGQEYTGVYRRELHNLDPGIYHIQVEMQFPRFSGFWKSVRRVEFPRVAVKADEKTFIRHSFSGPRDFAVTRKKGPAIPRRGDAPEVKPASGAAVLEIPVFE